MSRALQHLLGELRRFGSIAGSVVVSTNIPTRRDGLPYSSSAKPDDPGVAVYWSTARFNNRVLACDKWDEVAHNIHAIGLSLASLRSLERYGTTQILDRAFVAFGALPPARTTGNGDNWWDVLGLSFDTLGALTLAMVEARYRELVAIAHPDKTGDETELRRLNDAIRLARKFYDGK